MPGDNDVHKAAAKGETEKIRGLLDLTQYDDPPLSVNDLGASDRRPLHRAAGGGFLECSQFLLEAGAEIDAVDKSGRTALHFSCIGGHVDVTKMLLEKGINVLIVTQSKQSALHSAVEANKPPVIQAILEFLASDEEKKKQLFLIKNADDKTAWEVAVAARNKTLCQLLKDSGDPNAEGSAACVIC